jgi:hypothetical protein
MSSDGLDRAERLVDTAAVGRRPWGEPLVPSSVTQTDPRARDRIDLEGVVDRGQRAEVAVRARFVHLTRHLEYRRHSGTWVEESTAEDVPVEVVVRQDVSVPMTSLLRSDWVGFVGNAPGATGRREIDGRGSARLIETVAETVTWRLEANAIDVPGPHGLIRLGLRLRNTTEPLMRLADSVSAGRYSMVGCHLIVTISKGRFLPLDAPPEFARTVIEAGESHGTVPTVVGDERKVILASVGVSSAPGRPHRPASRSTGWR